MTMTWFDSELHELPIVWTLMESICEINLDEELLSMTYEVFTDGLEGYGYFDDLHIYRDRSNDLIMGSEVSYLLIEPSSGEFEIPVFACVKEDIMVVAAHIVPQENIPEGGETDYTRLRLLNKSGGTLGTRTFFAGAQAFEMDTISGVLDEVMTYGDVVVLKKEDFGAGMSLPQLLLIIEWNLA